MFWLQLRDGHAYDASRASWLCLVHSDKEPMNKLLKGSFWILQTILETDETNFEAQGDEESPLLKSALSGSEMSWSCGYGTSKFGRSLQVIGIATRKKMRERAVRLALAVAAATYELEEFQVPAQREGMDEFFAQLVEEAKRSHTRPEAAVPRRALVAASGPPVPVPEARPTIVQANRCQGDLIPQWRKKAKPKKQRSPPRMAAEFPLVAEIFEGKLDQWLKARKIQGLLQRDPERDRPTDDTGGAHWLYYKYCRAPMVEHSRWENALHGTWWYALWSILQSGVLLESCNEKAGHEFWLPGVYCTPNLSTARQYARAQQVFSDGMYHRVAIEVRYDKKQLRRQRERGGGQLVLPLTAVVIVGLLFLPNDTVHKGEERLNDWDAQLELVPHGRCRPAAPLEPPAWSVECVGEHWPCGR